MKCSLVSFTPSLSHHAHQSHIFPSPLFPLPSHSSLPNIPPSTGEVLSHYPINAHDHLPLSAHDARPVHPNGDLRIQFKGADGTIRASVFQGLEKVMVLRGGEAGLEKGEGNGEKEGKGEGGGKEEGL